MSKSGNVAEAVTVAKRFLGDLNLLLMLELATGSTHQIQIVRKISNNLLCLVERPASVEGDLNFWPTTLEKIIGVPMCRTMFAYASLSWSILKVLLKGCDVIRIFETGTRPSFDQVGTSNLAVEVVLVCRVLVPVTNSCCITFEFGRNIVRKAQVALGLARS